MLITMAAGRQALTFRTCEECKVILEYSDLPRASRGAPGMLRFQHSTVGVSDEGAHQAEIEPLQFILTCACRCLQLHSSPASFGGWGARE